MRTHTHSAEAGGALGWKKKVADALEDKLESLLRVLDAAQALCEGPSHTHFREGSQAQRARGFGPKLPRQEGLRQDVLC